MLTVGGLVEMEGALADVAGEDEPIIAVIAHRGEGRVVGPVTDVDIARGEQSRRHGYGTTLTLGGLSFVAEAATAIR